MKKKIVLALVVMTTLFTLTACNKQLIDTTYSFDKAIIKMPDDTVKEIDIRSWTDYENGEQLQIEATNGDVYLVSSINCILVKEKK